MSKQVCSYGALPSSSIHLIKFVLIIVLRHSFWSFFLLLEIDPIQRTRGIELQPGLDTLKIEDMVFMARKLHNKRIFVLKKRIAANGTAITLLQLLLGYSVELCNNRAV